MVHRNADGQIELTIAERTMIPWQDDFARDYITTTDDGRFILRDEGVKVLHDAIQEYADVIGRLADAFGELDEEDE